jgi:hypothetical protein
MQGLNENDQPLLLLLHSIRLLHYDLLHHYYRLRYSSHLRHRVVVDKSEIAMDS